MKEGIVLPAKDTINKRVLTVNISDNKISGGHITDTADNCWAAVITRNILKGPVKNSD
jgi:hypothetical protein